MRHEMMKNNNRRCILTVTLTIQQQDLFVAQQLLLVGDEGEHGVTE